MYFTKVILIFLFTIFTNVSFASTSIGKDSHLYPIMVDIRHKKYDEAMAKLEPYAQKGDAEALFWYGYMKQQNFGRDRYTAYRWFEKAAELGNPYAMYKLSGDADNSGISEVCDINGWPCSGHRFEEAMDKWKDLAKKGDIKANYIYRLKNRSFFVRFYENESGKSLEKMVAACRNGYCQPIVRTLRRLSMKSLENMNEGFGEAIMELEKYDPAILEARAVFFAKDLNKQERVSMLDSSLRKGYYKAGVSLFNLAISESLVSMEDAYVYGRVAELGKYKDGISSYLIENKLVSQQKVPELEKKAQEFFDNIEHVINFDEMDFMYMFRPDV
ncbi:tetratricopeptide repeat protein [Neptuniibacter sp. QD34_54]|uniref:tetratricopeptide repeat protein n=1 Tax=Neptuniibacter sp. QD34_54 TaxID=3398208 RepID=UPI0039F5231D